VHFSAGKIDPEDSSFERMMLSEMGIYRKAIRERQLTSAQKTLILSPRAFSQLIDFKDITTEPRPPAQTLPGQASPG